MKNMESPSWIVVRDLNNEQSLITYYYERLKSVVPTPETEFIEFTDTVETTDEIIDIMEEKGWKQSFIRTDRKAAPKSIERGSLILSRERDEVEFTVSSLLTQINDSDWEHRGVIVVRNRLNTNFCSKLGHHMCHPEVRYFIEGGEVLFKTSDKIRPPCQNTYSHYKKKLEDVNHPDEMAQKVAKEFTELSWSVDFILTEDFEWICVEMGLNGVRKHETAGWVNICGHGSKESHSPAVIHEPALRHIDDEKNKTEQ